MATLATQLNSGSGFAAGETVTATKLNNLVNTATVTSIQTADLASAVVSALVPAGAVMPFAMNSAPAGWLEADGTAVSRSTYAALFSAISTTYGAGDGSTTFALPDLRGIFVRGSGDQTISGTLYSKAFALKEKDEFKSHTHSTGLCFQGSGASQGISGALGLVSTTGATGGAETRPANIALLYCIKF